MAREHVDVESRLVPERFGLTTETGLQPPVSRGGREWGVGGGGTWIRIERQCCCRRSCRRSRTTRVCFCSVVIDSGRPSTEAPSDDSASIEAGATDVAIAAATLAFCDARKLPRAAHRTAPSPHPREMALLGMLAPPCARARWHCIM